MILYHGSNTEIREPKIFSSKRLLDFGAAFYLTSNFYQAEKWAQRTAKRREAGLPLISVFAFNEQVGESLKVLSFKEPNREWLTYVATNRTDKSWSDEYDLVIGPVANDQAIRTVNNYLKGYLTEDIAIQLLLPQKLKDQYAFKTLRSLEALEFVEVRSL